MENRPMNYIRCGVVPELKATNAERREVLHLISTASVDRAGDVVQPAGADVSNFLKNPVVLRNHSYQTEDIIGRAVALEIGDDGIHARTQFRDTDVGRDAFNLATEKLGGWSIGFRPIEFESIKDDKGKFKGFEFRRWELLEYSQVPIPMNQDAVNLAVKRGLVHQDNVALFFRVDRQTPPDEKSAPGSATATEADLDLSPLGEALLEAHARILTGDAAAGLLQRLKSKGM